MSGCRAFHVLCAARCASGNRIKGIPKGGVMHLLFRVLIRTSHPLPALQGWIASIGDWILITMERRRGKN